MLLAIRWTQGLKKWHRDRERLCSYPVLILMHIPASFPSLKGHFPRPSCHRPHLVLFVVLAQAWGCQAKPWHTRGQLHVSFFPPHYAGFRANQIVW